MILDIENLAWNKTNGLLPAIVQDAATGAILMLGYMSREALTKTLATKWVTFYSRSKKSLWTKGETSGNKLKLISICNDCDNDTLLIQAEAMGPTCHEGTSSCFKDVEQSDWQFIQELERTIKERSLTNPENSYTAKLLNAGISRIAQKVGEEGVEVALAAIGKDDEKLCDEVADLVFHLLVLLRARNLAFSNVIQSLKARRG